MKIKITASVPILLTVSLLILYAFTSFAKKQNSDNTIYILSVFLQIFTYVIPSIIYFVLNKRKIDKSFFHKKQKISHFKVIVLSAFLITLTGALWSSILYGLGVTNDLNLLYFPKDNVLLTTIIFIAIPAFLEEFFFRGLILREYQKYGRFTAVIFTSVCFAMFHLSIPEFPYYFVAGVVLSCVAFITDSLLEVFILHLLHNLVTLFFGNYLINLLYNFADTSFVILILFILVLLFLFWFLSALDTYYKKVAFLTTEIPKTPNKSIMASLAECFLSPYFLLFSLIFVAIVFDVF